MGKSDSQIKLPKHELENAQTGSDICIIFRIALNHVVTPESNTTLWRFGQYSIKMALKRKKYRYCLIKKKWEGNEAYIKLA